MSSSTTVVNFPLYIYVCVCVRVCVCIYIYIFKHTHKHTHTHTYIYIHTYICIFWSHFFISTNFFEYNRHFLSTYFLVDPFILPYCFYSIRCELIDIFSIIVYFPSTFCPTLGHHQGRVYYKSDVTFACTLLLCKKKEIWAVAVCSVYF